MVMFNFKVGLGGGKCKFIGCLEELELEVIRIDGVFLWGRYKRGVL